MISQKWFLKLMWQAKSYVFSKKAFWGLVKDLQT
jgi:hypothetical protein